MRQLSAALRQNTSLAVIIADALIAYLDTGTAPGTITRENTFVARKG